jgi:branched-chain amino acid transport system substrate-binding protein
LRDIFTKLEEKSHMRTLKFLRVALLITLFVIAFSPAHAQSDKTKVVVPPGGTIKLIVQTDLTGPIAQMGLDIGQSAQLAVADKNAAGGIKGFQVEISVEDERCDAKEGTAVATRVASNPDIVGVVGPTCSGPLIASAEFYEAARIPFVSASATRADLTSLGYDVLNRVAFSDGNQGRFAANYIYSVLGVTKIAILHDNAAYGQGIAQVVQAEFERLGGEVVAFQGINVDDQDYRPVLTPLLDSAPGVIYFGGYEQQAVFLVTQMKDVGLADAIFYTDDGVFSQSFIEGAGAAAEGVYATFANPPEVTDAIGTFDAAYLDMFGVEAGSLGPYHYHAYDAANLLMLAIENVAVVDDAGNLVIDREALVKNIRELKDYPGLTGTLTCSEIGECGTGTIGVNIVENGGWIAAEVPEGFMAPAALDGNKLVDERCTVCHNRERIDAKKASGADRAAWEVTVDRMIGNGAQLNAEEREAVLSFLAGG